METVQLKKHISQRKSQIKYIVIHDTANKSAKAGAIAHKNYFLTTNRKASADFVIEENKIIKLNDYEKYFTWHCGDGKGKFGITNSNSIGLEMCINSDANMQKTINSTIILVYKLMKELKIPIEKVVRHYDASRKICPASLSYDNWRGWVKFKNALHDYIEEREDENNYVVLEYKNKKAVCERILKNNYNYIKVRDIANLLNIKIVYDSTKIKLVEKENTI